MAQRPRARSIRRDAARRAPRSDPTRPDRSCSVPPSRRRRRRRRARVVARCARIAGRSGLRGARVGGARSATAPGDTGARCGRRRFRHHGRRRRSSPRRNRPRSASRPRRRGRCARAARQRPRARSTDRSPGSRTSRSATVAIESHGGCSRNQSAPKRRGGTSPGAMPAAARMIAAASSASNAMVDIMADGTRRGRVRPGRIPTPLVRESAATVRLDVAPCVPIAA